VGGCQSGGAGSFPRTKREVFGGTKIHLFGVEYLNFGATYLSFGGIYLNLGAVYANFGAKIENRVFSRGVGGGWVGPSGPPRDFGIGIGKKYSAHPLSPTHHPRILIRSTIFQWKSSGTIKSRSFYKFIIWNPVCGFHDVYPSIELVCCGNI